MNTDLCYCVGTVFLEQPFPGPVQLRQEQIRLHARISPPDTFLNRILFHQIDQSLLHRVALPTYRSVRRSQPT